MDAHTLTMPQSCMQSSFPLQALERAPPPKVKELHSSVAKGVDSFAKEAEKLSPFTMIGEQTKARAAVAYHGMHADMWLRCPTLSACVLRWRAQNQVKGALKSNWPRIVIGFFEVSLYCALYHHATEEVKKRTKHRRCAH